MKKYPSWPELIYEFESSGLTQSEFALRHHLNIHTFKYWLYKCRAADRFVPVSVVKTSEAEKQKDSTGTRWSAEIEFQGGIILRLCEISPELLSWIATALRK